MIGGGAAGYFAAITVAEADPSAQVTIYEQSKRTLQKVKISGGGRCNITHNCFDPKELTGSYPHGSRELHGAFHRWQPQDTIEWFSKRGVEIKAEPDGRMFPTTDDSQTIIDCFHQAAQKAGVQLRKETSVKSISLNLDASFNLELKDGAQVRTDKILVAAGSLKASTLTKSLEALGHTIEPLAPSLFAFNVTDKRTQGLSGLSVQNACVHVLPDSNAQTGPLLITHRGFSGPAILRLSAWEARRLQQQQYDFKIAINWLGDWSEHRVREHVTQLRRQKGATPIKHKVFDTLPRRLWGRIIEAAGVDETMQWSQLSRTSETRLIQELTAARFSVQGKTTNKEEFVTCGGIRLKEVDFRTMESRKAPGLYFAGECLDIDGITGGFNFQAAWTTGHIAGESMAGSQK